MKPSDPLHEAITRSWISNGKQETLWVCSHCLRLMTTRDLLFYHSEHNAMCVCVCLRRGEGFTTLFTVKHLLWRIISCLSFQCSSSCSHLADTVSCHALNRERQGRVSIFGDSQTKAAAWTERHHFTTFCSCWQRKDGHGFGGIKVLFRDSLFFSFSIKSQLYCTFITRL